MKAITEHPLPEQSDPKDVLYWVIHDTRAPLAGMKNSARLLITWLEKDTPAASLTMAETLTRLILDRAAAVDATLNEVADYLKGQQIVQKREKADIFVEWQIQSVANSIGILHRLVYAARAPLAQIKEHAQDLLRALDVTSASNLPASGDFVAAISNSISEVEAAVQEVIGYLGEISNASFKD